MEHRETDQQSLAYAGVVDAGQAKRRGEVPLICATATSGLVGEKMLNTQRCRYSDAKTGAGASPCASHLPYTISSSARCPQTRSPQLGPQLLACWNPQAQYTSNSVLQLYSSSSMRLPFSQASWYSGAGQNRIKSGDRSYISPNRTL